MNKPSRVVPFILGLVLGILGMIFLPSYVRPYIPDWLEGKTVVVKGTVAAKQKKGNTLLLTVDTPQGALLATFTRKVDEISLLVNEKDAIEFTLPKYKPFIEDPRIVRIVKEQQAAPEPAPVVQPAERSAKEGRSQRQEKPQAAAPARGGATEMKPPDRK